METRREALQDAAIEVLAREGARGLTHRAVDREAGVPVGTTSNYFRTRDALLGGLASRIDARLRPTSEAAAALTEGIDDPEARLRTLIRAIVPRVLSAPSLYMALLELRLEASRRPALRAALTETLRTNYEADVAFQEGAEVPGGRREVQLLHLAIDGLLLDRLTVPDALDLGDIDALVDELVELLVLAPSRAR